MNGISNGLREIRFESSIDVSLGLKYAVGPFGK